jgi:regulator of protease activity HflC (stomatin/prohibitin superfamily)
MLELLQSLTGLFLVVYDGQHALRFTLGRATGVVGPGVHLKLPIIQKFVAMDTRHTTLDLAPQVIQLSDDLIYEVDAKLVYQVTDVMKAIVNIDNLVTGMQNRVVIAIQSVLRRKDRVQILQADVLCSEIVSALAPMEQEWGVRVVQFGFSNLSPSPATLEITQLDLLAREKLSLLKHLRSEGLREESAVALLSGAVVSLAFEETGTPR